MGIFDEAIREHLELKRQHGAGDSELRELEDEAFGAPARPGDAAVAEAPPALDSEAPTELASIQETPELVEPADGEAADAAQALPEIEEPPPAPDDAGTVAIETEEHPPPEGASAPEPVPEEAQEPGASIVDQPTELYDPQDAGLPADASPEPPEVEDEFFSEQSLSDELDQALDAREEGAAPVPEPRRRRRARRSPRRSSPSPRTASPRTARTSSRRPRSSSRTRPSMIASGSSSGPPRTSTSTIE